MRYDQPLKKKAYLFMSFFSALIFFSGMLGGTSALARADTPVSEDGIAQGPECIPGSGVMWVNGQLEPEVAAQAQQQFAQAGIHVTVQARSYGEMDSCGTYAHQGLDFTVNLLQAAPGAALARQEFIKNILSVLTQYGKPALGNITLVDSNGAVIPLESYRAPLMTAMQAAGPVPANAISKKVYVIVYDPLVNNGQKLSVYENWYDHSALTQQTIDFFKLASGNKLNYTVVDTTIVNAWPELIDGFTYTESEYLAVLSGQQLPHSPVEVNYNKIVNAAQFDICGRVNRGEVDEVWIYNAPWFGFYESTLVGPGAYYFNSLPVDGAHGCNKLIPIMGPSVQRSVTEAVHNFTHRAEYTMKMVYGSWSQNSISHNWNRFTLSKALSPNYSYSGCGTSHYPPNGTSNYDYSNASSALSNCSDFANYPNLGDPLQVAQPVTCSAWGCTNLGFFEYWFGHFPSNAGCGADLVASNWWSYIANPALALYPPIACQSDARFISGNAGIGDVTLSFTDGTAKTVTSDMYGNYFLVVSNHWSGSVVPSKNGGYTFGPVSKNYIDVQTDQYEQNFTAALSGPEMGVSGGNVMINDGDNTPSLNDDTDFGSAAVTGGTVSRTFTISNTGAGTLNLSGSPIVTVGGAHAADFSVTQQPSSPVAAAGSVTFTVAFDPAASGVRTASISIVNNDSNENPYDFSIQGFGSIYPEMDVNGNNVSIANGDFTPSATDDTYFGSVATSGESASRTFTIINSGGGDLNLTGSPRVTINGNNASDFSVSLQPAIQTIAPSGSTTFTIVFDPSADGVRTAFVSIANDDSNENPYIFFVQGSGNFFPSMEVRGKSDLQIASGDPSPNLLDGTDFSGALTEGGTRSNTFTINNTGAGGLSLTGTPIVLVTGTNSSDFTVQVDPSSTIGPGGSTTFTIVFDPGASGVRTASISIYNDDAAKNPYTFAIRGTGIGPEINLTGNNITIINGDDTPSISDNTDFGGTALAGGIVSHVFTIRNSGSSNLNLTGSPKVFIGGANAADFSVTVQPASPVAFPSGTAAFTVTFDPLVDGLRTAFVRIANDDANENPYIFFIQGIGIGEYPRVLSILRMGSSPTSAAGVNYAVTFSGPVTGVAPGDFTLTTGRVSGAAVSGVSGKGSVYTVSVSTGTGNGTLRLDIPSGATITDPFGNPLDGIPYTSGEMYMIIKSATFTDTPLTHWAGIYIERLYIAGITGGCVLTPLQYCPDGPVTRAQMAVFLLKSMHGSGFVPPAINGSTGFGDVAADHWAAAWIKQLAAEGITSGCGNGNYCPESTVTRAQMAVFLLKAKHGSSYTPANATGVFTDVPVGYWADKWIEQLAAEGVTSGCGNGNYCPDDSVTRAQMAVFLVKAFALP